MKYRLSALLVLLFSSPAFAQYAAPDPAGSGPIAGAVDWLQGTLLGNVATAVAVIAVAAVGFMMLSGRVNWKYHLGWQGGQRQACQDCDCADRASCQTRALRQDRRQIQQVPRP